MYRENVRHFLAIQTYGWITDDPNDLGSNGSKARVECAVDLVRDSVIPKDDLVAIFPQGYCKKDPTRNIYGSKESLGENVGRYFLKVASGLNISTLIKPLTWGTDRDVQMTMMQIDQYLGIDNPTIRCVHFISDPCHIQRVMIPGCACSSPRFRVVFHPAMNHRLPTFQRVVREPVARLVYRFIFQGFEKVDFKV